MKYKLKKIFLILLVAAAHSSFAQEKFDLVSYTAPRGWKQQATGQTIQWSKEDAAKGTFCILMIFKAIPGTNSSRDNFNAAWDNVVNGMVKITGSLEMQPASTENGWEALSGYAPFESDGQKGVALLATSTGYGKMVNILAMTNTEIYQDEMGAFFESVKLAKPDASSNPINPAIKAGNTGTANNNVRATKDGFTYTTTNFTEGWTSTVYSDYVLTTKGSIKVYLSYVEKFNASDFTGNGKEARHYYWNNYVSKYFTTGEMRYNRGGALSDYSDDYIEAWATDKQTNEKRYIAMILRIVPYTGTLSIIIASAPDNQQLRQQFPKADLKFNNDLLPMYGFNKFAVGKNDLAGKWSSSGGGTMNWYSTTTGQNVGATGAVSSDVFNFNAGGTYTSSHKGATGWVGSMNTYQQEYRGVYNTTDWSLTITNRFQGKTENYDAWFEVVKGGRALHLQNKQYSGSQYTLFRER